MSDIIETHRKHMDNSVAYLVPVVEGKSVTGEIVKRPRGALNYHAVFSQDFTQAVVYTRRAELGKRKYAKFLGLVFYRKDAPESALRDYAKKQFAVQS